MSRHESFVSTSEKNNSADDATRVRLQAPQGLDEGVVDQMSWWKGSRRGYQAAPAKPALVQRSDGRRFAVNMPDSIPDSSTTSKRKPIRSRWDTSQKMTHIRDARHHRSRRNTSPASQAMKELYSPQREDLDSRAFVRRPWTRRCASIQNGPKYFGTVVSGRQQVRRAQHRGVVVAASSVAGCRSGDALRHTPLNSENAGR